MDASGIGKSILVQADSSYAEINWLLELADQNPTIIGIVGWADMKDSNLDERLQEFRLHPRFKGVRINTPDSFDEGDFIYQNLQMIGRIGLTCDILSNPESLPFIVSLVKRCPDTQFIIDHLAGLPIIPNGHQAWSKAARSLSELPNAALKLSGYLGYARPRPPTTEMLRPYVEAALELFKPARLMYGSDWPVCTLGGPYVKTVELLLPILESLSPSDQLAIWGGTSEIIYRTKDGK
jgi:L-fuconolactonase